MMNEPRKPRKDKDTKRVTNVREPLKFTVSLKGHGIDAKVSAKIEEELQVLKETNPTATPKTVLIKWISKLLKLKEDGS